MFSPWNMTAMFKGLYSSWKPEDSSNAKEMEILMESTWNCPSSKFADRRVLLYIICIREWPRTSSGTIFTLPIWIHECWWLMNLWRSAIFFSLRWHLTGYHDNSLRKSWQFRAKPMLRATNIKHRRHKLVNIRRAADITQHPTHTKNAESTKQAKTPHFAWFYAFNWQYTYRAIDSTVQWCSYEGVIMGMSRRSQLL